MKTKDSLQKAFRGFYSMTNIAVWICYVALTAIVLLVFLDVLGRYFLNRPLKGAFELVLLSMTILGGFAMMYTAAKWGHVSIDLITRKFPNGVQNIMQRITSFVGCAFWMVMAYMITQNALQNSANITDILRIPTQPFRFILAVATFLFSLVLLIQAIEPKHETKEDTQE